MLTLYGLMFFPIGYVFTQVLMEDVLCFYTRFLHRLPPMVAKPLGLCGACFTGQLSLWGTLPLLIKDLQATGQHYLYIIMYLSVVSINIILVTIFTKHGNQEN